MAAAPAPADPTPTVWNPTSGQYEDPPAQGPPAQGAPAQGAPAANDDGSTPTRWNAATGEYEDDPPAPAPKKKPTAKPATSPPVTYDAAEFKRRVGRDPEPAELANFQQFKGRGWANENGAPSPDASPPSAIGTYIKETIADPALTGAEKAKQVGAFLASPLRSKEATAESIANAQQAMPAEPEYLKQADAVFAQQHTFLGVLDAYVHNPRAVLANSIKGLVQGGGVMLASTLGGAVAGSEGGPVGAAAGAAAGGAGAGYLQTYSETVLSTLQAHGVDLADKDAVLKALNDPALMSAASVAAHKAGVPSAIINGLSFGLAGRVAGPVAGAIGRGAVGRAAGAGAEVVTQAGIGAGGEAGTQLAQQGAITNPNAIAQAGVSQAAVTAPFMAHGVFHAGEHGPAAQPGAEPTQAAGAPETAPNASGATNAPPAGSPGDYAATARAIDAAEQEGDAQEREVARRAAEDHFTPLAADSLANIDQTIAPARRPVVEAGPANAMELGQQHAADAVRAAGGDALSQVVAATHAGAVLGGVHDAAAVQGARESEQASRETQRQAALDEWDKAWNAEPAGRSNEPALPPRTLAPALTPEQLQAFQTLKDRRNAVMAEPAAENTKAAEPQSEPAATPPNRLAAIRDAAVKRQQAAAPAKPVEPTKDAEPAKAAEPAGEEEQPASNPPAMTPKTLADRRQAQMDAAMSAKVRGTVHEAPQEVEDRARSEGGDQARIEFLQSELEATSPNDPDYESIKEELRGMGHAPDEAAPATLAGRRAAAQAAPAEATGMHGQRIADIAKREAAFQRDTGYKKLMSARPKDVGALVDKMTPEDAQAHLARLDAAPGTNDAARSALATRTAPGGETAESPPQRKILSLGDRRTRFADSNTPPTRVEDVQHYSDKDGFHATQTPSGETHAVETASGDLRVTRSDPAENLRGRGEAATRMERLANEVHPTGGRLTSGKSVSPDQEHVYDSLARRGYDVQQHPGATRNEAGSLVSPDPREPVFSVGPKRDATQAGGLELRRRADAGDKEAQDEMGRRLNAQPSAQPNEPTRAAPEEGALAPRRDAAQSEARRAPPVRKEEVQQHLAPLIEKLGADRLHVHDSLADADIPEHVRQEAAAGLHDDPRGYYDPKTGEVHIFAGSRGHATAADAVHTAVHEMAHAGLRRYLGPDYDRVMQDVFDNIHNNETDVRSPIPGVDKTTAREWTRDYISQHGYDPTNKAAQVRAADEYIAHLSEQDMRSPGKSENPGLLQHVFNGIRTALRKLFRMEEPGRPAHEWSDDDLRQLLRESNNDKVSPHAKRAAQRSGDALRFADSDASEADRYAHDDPRAVSQKFAATVDRLADHSPGYVKSRADLVEAQKDKYEREGARNWDPEMLHEAALSGMQLQNLPDVVDPNGKLYDHAVKFGREVTDRTVRAEQLKAPGKAVLKEGRDTWARENPELDRKLQKLESDSTLARVDPSKKFEPLYSDEEKAASSKKDTADALREKAHEQLVSDYNKLDAKGQELYQRKRDVLRDLREAEFKATDKRAEALGMSDGPRKDLMTLLDKKFGRGRIEPYFALSRYGSRWSVAKDAEGKTAAYERFESQKAQNDWEAARVNEGLTIGGRGKDIDMAGSILKNSDPAFLRDVEKATESISDTAERDNLRNDIYQRYLERLSNNSIKKHSMRRAGVPGFNKDMWRSFADYVDKSGNNIAQLEHNHKIDQHLQGINDEAGVLQNKVGEMGGRRNSIDAQWGTALAKEFNARRAWIDNPHDNPLMSAVTRGGFSWMIGFNPASAFRVLTQNFRNSAPALAAEHGLVRGRGALWGANATWLKNHAENALHLASFQRSKAKGSVVDALRGDERKAMEWIRDTGAFSNTQANALTETARGSTPTPTYKEIGRGLTDPTTPLSDRVKAAAASSFRKTIVEPYVAGSKALFQAAEVHNRETSALAGTRLALEQGKSWQDAAWHGMRMTNLAHFDYSLTGRPRAVTSAGPLGSIGKPVGQFRQYDLGQIDRLSRDALDAVFNNRNLSSEQRAIAAKRFVQTQLTGLALYGAVGIPVLSSIASMLANRVMSIQQGQPVGSALISPEVDAKAMWRDHLTHQYGAFLANSIIDGPASAIAGAALTGSDADLFYRPPFNPNQTWEEDLTDRIASAIPALSMYTDAAMGVDQLAKGNVSRALEHFIPHGFRGLLKQNRVEKQGLGPANAVPESPDAVDVSGQYVVPPHTVSAGDRARIALGFPPEDIKNAYESKTATDYEEKQVNQELDSIKQQGLEAAMIKDPEARAQAMAKVQAEWEALHKRFPGMKMPDLNKDINSRYRKAGKTVKGTTVTPANLPIVQRYAGASLPPNLAPPEPTEAPQ